MKRRENTLKRLAMHIMQTGAAINAATQVDQMQMLQLRRLYQLVAGRLFGVAQVVSGPYKPFITTG